jgi:hypothetical protein
VVGVVGQRLLYGSVLRRFAQGAEHFRHLPGP